MKWTDELVEQLRMLVEGGYNIPEISSIMKTTRQSISSKMRRLRLNIKIELRNRIEIECLMCGILFFKYETGSASDQKFCSRSCSVKCNNLKRGPHSEARKLKISNGIKSREDYKPYHPKPSMRFCKSCNVTQLKPRCVICDQCKMTYYKYYRPACEFKFEIQLFAHEFHLALVDEYGWYSLHNQSGVSRDHMYSVKAGFINNISPDILNHPANCAIMLHIENNKKKTRSSITIDELLERIRIWDMKYSILFELESGIPPE